MYSEKINDSLYRLKTVIKPKLLDPMQNASNRVVYHKLFGYVVSRLRYLNVINSNTEQNCYLFAQKKKQNCYL